MSDHLETIRTYYDGCSRGDVDLMCSTLTDDVVHYFLAPNPGSRPVAGAEHLARYWRKVHSLLAATWVVDHIVDQGDEAVIEWTMFWNPPDEAPRTLTRGAEWFCFSDGRIREIRSYYQQHAEPTELDSFPYEERSYSRLGQESSARHPSTQGARP